MKILMLGWELPPHHSGGLGVACYQLCKYLAQSGADIDFVLPYEADFNIDFMRVKAASSQSYPGVVQLYGDAYDEPTVKRQWQGGEGPLTSPLQDRYIDTVLKLANYGEFDILHAHDWLTMRAAMLAKQHTNLPLIVHIHATEYDRSGGGKGNPMVRDIEYNGMMMADQIIAVSQATKDTIVREYAIPADKIEVIHNSLELATDHISDATVYAYLAAMKQQGYRVVLSAGRLTIQKGLTTLMRAAQIVVEHEPKTYFLFVGNGEQYYELVELAAGLGISQNVIFTGHLNGTGKQWRDSFRIADLFVMPSVSEPFGIAALEAVAYGTPVLVSKQSGVAEILQHALKVDFWDVDEMANQITAVIQNNPLRDHLHQNAERDYRNYSWQHAADRLTDLYRHHREPAIT